MFYNLGRVITKCNFSYKYLQKHVSGMLFGIDMNLVRHLEAVQM